MEFDLFKALNYIKKELGDNIKLIVFYESTGVAIRIESITYKYQFIVPFEDLKVNILEFNFYKAVQKLKNKINEGK